jgi:hypothetical protein
METKIGKRNTWFVIKLSFLFTAFPMFCFANMGSALGMFSLLHLIFINVAIGWVENRILKKFGVAHNNNLIYYANFFSMAVGYLLIGSYFVDHNWATIGKISTVMLGLLICYFATLILEYPFFYWSLEDKSQLKKLNLSFLVANTITNAVIALMYYLMLQKDLNY